MVYINNNTKDEDNKATNIYVNLQKKHNEFIEEYKQKKLEQENYIINKKDLTDFENKVVNDILSQIEKAFK